MSKPIPLTVNEVVRSTICVFLVGLLLASFAADFGWVGVVIVALAALFVAGGGV